MKRAALVLVCACWTSQSTKPEPAAPTKPGNGARVIEQTASGGVIQLVGDRTAAMADARAVMERQCGVRAYTIVQEHEGRVTYACTQ